MDKRLTPILLALPALACASLGIHLCATGEYFEIQGSAAGQCVCKAGHVKDDDGKGCHVGEGGAQPAPGGQGCALPGLPECGRSESAPGVYGCCFTDRHRPLPASPFDAVVDEVQEAISRERPDLFDREGRADETRYTAEVARRLRARGLCATVGGPADEVGLKTSNAESFQYDVHLGNGRPRRSGYTAYCRPARF
jgi:hypothetical protein